jgi:hypothetical protein
MSVGCRKCLNVAVAVIKFQSSAVKVLSVKEDRTIHIFLKREAGKAFTRLFYIKRFRFIVLNATFNNIAVIW